MVCHPGGGIHSIEAGQVFPTNIKLVGNCSRLNSPEKSAGEQSFSSKTTLLSKHISHQCDFFASYQTARQIHFSITMFKHSWFTLKEMAIQRDEEHTSFDNH